MSNKRQSNSFLDRSGFTLISITKMLLNAIV